MKQRFSKRTRLVSALLTLAMVFTFLPFSAFAEEELTDNYGIIPLAEYVLPDKAFREYLKEFDTNGDDILAPAERYAVTTIDVSHKNISNLFGIQFFPNLKMLYCYNNHLTELDVSKNTALVYLDCTENQLTELDVRQNVALWRLYCDRNELSSLDVSKNTALEYLDCHLNNLTSLDLRYNTELKQLDCNGNNLTSLDVSKNTALTLLNCRNNQLTELDVSKNTVLEGLYCDDNQLSSLDVRQNTALKYLYCSDNQLTELDVSRNNKIYKLSANNNYLTSLNVENTSINLDNSSSEFAALGNTYPITVGSDRTFDLSTLPGTFDVTKATRWNGGTVRGNTLTVKAGETKVTYLYNCGKRSSYTFTLNVTVVPEGSIVIDASNFPDPEFRAYVKAKLDTDNNNSLSESERNAVTKIDVHAKSIDSLKGIEFFPNLETLYCYNNKLTSLDVSKNEKLADLWCSQNNLTSLDVSKNPELKELWCSDNNLTSLDVSKNIALQKLACSGNQLTSLDVSQTAVTTLNASDNQIDINVETTPRTFDLSTLPGAFDASKATNWNGGTVDGSTLKVDEGATQVTYTYDCGNDRNVTFTLNVTVVPDGTVTPPSGGDGTGTTTPPSSGDGTGTTTPPSGGGTGTTTPPSGGDGGGGAVIIMAAGAAAAGVVGYGVYNYVSGRKLQALLPEGVAAPENRAQTALLLWNTAGRPEPAEAPAFADVADPDTAKAAQWCVEQGLMKRRLNGKFAPGSSIPAYQVLNAYRKLAG